MSLEDSEKKFKDYLQRYDRLHDQPSKMFMEHLGKDYIQQSNGDDMMSRHLMQRMQWMDPDGIGDPPFYDWPEPGICRRCREEGIWVNGECVCGCVECVKTNNWTWGTANIFPVDGDELHMTSIPCNGSRPIGADEVPTEYTNLELVLKILTDIWDHVPDWATENPETVPRWSEYFDISPERTHAIICKELNLWQMPETARNLPMEPGQPWTLQTLLPDPNVLEDDEVIEAITNLEPRQLFQDEEEETSDKKELCTKAQELLDESISGTFNEESYRQLSNILMKIHQG
jgi:hypothetical protein